MLRMIFAVLVSLFVMGGPGVTTAEGQVGVQLTISPWKQVGKRGEWKSTMSNAGELAEITIKIVGGELDFKVEWECTADDKSLPKRILSWRFGERVAKGFGCKNEPISSEELPQPIEEASLRAESFPHELRGKFKIPPPRVPLKKFEYPPPPPKEEALIDWHLRRGVYRI